VSKTVKRLPLTVQDLTTQASNEFITSYLHAQPRPAAIQAGFGDWALGAANAVRQAHFEGDRRERER
jgi:ABC-type sugar transport system substrate-binding protein